MKTIMIFNSKWNDAMLKIIYTLFLAIAFVLTSCDKDYILENGENKSNNAEFTFTLLIDNDSSDSLQSRSGSVIIPKRWIMEVWDATGNNKVNCFGLNLDSHRSENSNGTFMASLDKTKTYTCLFWADNGIPNVDSIVGSNGTYNADDLKAIVLANSVTMHTKDAYFANVEIKGASQYIELKRAVAEVRLVEIGVNPLENITVTYSGYNGYDISTKGVTGEFISFSHTFLKSEFETIGSEKKIGSFLVFATDSEAGNSIDLTVKESETDIGRIIMIPSVKLQSNEITNVRGKFFTDTEKVIFIKSINVTPKSDNVLRVDVNIEFDKIVNYQIEYWKKDNYISREITVPKKSESFITETLLFLEPETQYMFKVIAHDHLSVDVSEIYNFTTDALPVDLLLSMTMEEDKLEKEPFGYILQMGNYSLNYVTIFNMKGIMVWYQNMKDRVQNVTFDEKTKTISCIIGMPSGDDVFVFEQEIAVIDLMGKELLRKLYTDLYAHHDIRRTPDGNIIVVNRVPKTFDLTQYGGVVDDVVWGDGYTIMDMSGEIKETWDCFEELSPLDDPKIMSTKDDWLHANSINFDSEGNIYMSFNWTSELWKIEKRSGNVSYRIGKNGNFNISPSGYTSSIHTLMPLGPNKILLLDNGNDNLITRAMIYEVDEDNKKVEITLNVPLPLEYHTRFMGNVEIIEDDLLMFNSSMKKAVVFTDYKGNVKRVLTQKGLKHSPYRSIYIPAIRY